MLNFCCCVPHAVVFLLAAWLLPTSAHICITSPKQRGPLNTSDPLDPSCARVGWPCGGQALRAPPYPLITINPNYYNLVNVVRALLLHNTCVRISQWAGVAAPKTEMPHPVIELED
jgi:hypothetical protein